MKDAILVKNCKKGSAEALSRIYEKYRDYLLILAVALSHDVNMAEDALHDVFVNFAKRIQVFELKSSLKGYLATCIVNRIRDMLKRKDRNNISLDNDRHDTTDSNEPSQRIICNEQLKQLAAALSEIPIKQREVIAMHIHGQMSFNAIARSLNISANTIRGRYRYGISKLRSIMNVEVRK